MIRSFGKYLLSLILSLFVATIAIIPLEGSPEPGSFPRLVWVIIFFTVFTLLFAWDSGYLNR
jgi:hypothetical protein